MFQKILVPMDIDYPKICKAVYDNAFEIASRNNAQIKIVSVMPGFSMPMVASVVTDEVKKEARDHFEKALYAFIQENCSPEHVSCSVLVGKHYEEILKVADSWPSDLIIVYHNHRRRVNEAFSDTCARKIVTHAKCSVLRLRNIF